MKGEGEKCFVIYWGMTLNPSMRGRHGLTGFSILVRHMGPDVGDVAALVRNSLGIF